MNPHFDRRRFLGLASMTAASMVLPASAKANVDHTPGRKIFNGQNLDGWLQYENSSISFSPSAILDPASLLARLAQARDPLSAYLRPHLADALAQDGGSTPHDVTSKSVLSALARDLNQVVEGPSLFDPQQFANIHLRDETRTLLRDSSVAGVRLMRLNKLLLEDAFPSMLAPSVSAGWTVQDGALTSLGTGRGVLYTAQDYDHFRISFSMRHVSGAPDHQACVLLFCQRPDGVAKPLDALGGIQFQVPNGGHWDYRPGRNVGNGPEFTRPADPHFDPHQWSRVEIVANARQGVARMAVAQPEGGRGIHVLDFQNAAGCNVGPFALQMHNAGLVDQYKDIVVEENPASNDLLLLT